MITGRCLCKKISYEYRGEPLFQAICCCEDCQRASGSSHVPVIGADKSGFSVFGTTKTYVSVGGSGNNAVRHFCPDCGSLLFGTPEEVNDLVTIYAGTLDNKEILNPSMAIYTRSKMHWEVFNDNIVLHETKPGK